MRHARKTKPMSSSSLSTRWSTTSPGGSFGPLPCGRSMPVPMWSLSSSGPCGSPARLTLEEKPPPATAATAAATLCATAAAAAAGTEASCARLLLLLLTIRAAAAVGRAAPVALALATAAAAAAAVVLAGAAEEAGPVGRASLPFAAWAAGVLALAMCASACCSSKSSSGCAPARRLPPRPAWGGSGPKRGWRSLSAASCPAAWPRHGEEA